MSKFKVAVSWECFGVVEIEAESLEDALCIAETDPDIPLPEGEYVDGSYSADYEQTMICQQD